MYIPQWLDKKLSKDSLEKIESCIKKVEEKTQAEVVPMLVKKSSSSYRKELVILFLMAITAALYTPLWLAPLVIIAYYLVSRRFLSLRKKDVRSRALLEFYESDIRSTIGGTGVLLLVSLEERVVEVVVDKKINDMVDQDTWVPVSDAVIQGMKHHSIEEAFCSGVGVLGDILSQLLPAEEENSDELKNHLIIKE